MTLREIAALMRRHLLAVTVVLLIAAGGGYYIGNTPPMYSESATVVFTAKNSPSGASSNASFIAPLIATEVMMAQTFLTPPAQSEVRAAGGTASFQFVPLNLYSEQYPNYDEPDATLTTTSQRPADAERTFTGGAYASRATAGSDAGAGARAAAQPHPGVCRRRYRAYRSAGLVDAGVRRAGPAHRDSGLHGSELPRSAPAVRHRTSPRLIVGGAYSLAGDQCHE